MSDERFARDERRRKIRELESSLFGESTSDAFKVDVPQLKNVDEYFDRFGKAERQQRRTQPTSNADGHFATFKTSFSTIASRTSKRTNDKNVDDTNHLLSDDDDADADADADADDGNEENYNVGKSFGKVKISAA